MRRRDILDAIRTHAVRGLLVVAIGLLVVTFARGCEANTRADGYLAAMTKWKDSANAVVTHNAQLLRYSDSVTNAVTTNVKKTDSLTTVVTSLRTKQTTMRRLNDSLLAVKKVQLPDTCQPVLELAERYRDEADSLNKALDVAQIADSINTLSITLLRSNVDSLRLANAELKSVIVTVPVYKPEKFLGLIPLPSRKQALVTGFVAGIATTAVVITSIHR